MIDLLKNAYLKQYLVMKVIIPPFYFGWFLACIEHNAFINPIWCFGLPVVFLWWIELISYTCLGDNRVIDPLMKIKKNLTEEDIKVLQKTKKVEKILYWVLRFQISLYKYIPYACLINSFIIAAIYGVHNLKFIYIHLGMTIALFIARWLTLKVYKKRYPDYVYLMEGDIFINAIRKLVKRV